MAMCFLKETKKKIFPPTLSLSLFNNLSTSIYVALMHT